MDELSIDVEEYHNAGEPHVRGRYGRMRNRRVKHEKFRNAPISIWWEIESCPAPRHPCVTSKKIVETLRNMDYNGTVTTFIYGRVPSVKVQDALRKDGIVLRYAREDEGIINKDRSKVLKRMSEDMLLFTLSTPAPANYLLITEDAELPYLRPFLFTLKKQKFNIFIAQMNEVKMYLNLCTWIWHWLDLAAGGPPIPEEEMEYMMRSRTWRIPLNKQEIANINKST